MRRTPYPRDARLWAFLAEEFRAAGVTDRAASQRHARRAVAWVRRERQPETASGVTSWGPGDAIPAHVVWVYDLDGDVWEREPGGLWRMSSFDPDEVEEAAGGEYDDAGLLERYGPVTGSAREVAR